MDRSQNTDSERRRHPRRSHARFAPVVWIAVLLASWFVIVEWKMLPDVVSAAMGVP
jgi:hypothetical protein